ncbi:MAG: tRNA nucleotidyltransferase (CCA-adding enzyme) [Cellvibrionaceae bacterium]|jgi:tRNA nucleotidyltransferase (CCA-adding enzyme)
MKKYLVGGAVRDQLLNFPFSEKDWVVVGSSPEEMMKLGYRPVGKDFPVFLHPQTGEEYALARTERKTAPGYKGFTFHTGPSVNLEEDLERRDLTINAIAQDDNGELIDPYNGQEDLEKRLLRHVSLAFAEDPVRVLRVARFGARYHYLGFTVATETLDLMHAMVVHGETKHLVAERVWQELAKALGEKSPQYFFSILDLCDALKDILPEVSSEHYKGSVHLLSKMAGLHNSPQLRFMAICYPLKHEVIQNLCRRLGAPTEYRNLALLFNQHAETLVSIAEHHIDISRSNTETSIPESDPKAIANILQKLDPIRKQERFKKLIDGAAALFYKKDHQKWILFWTNTLKAYSNVNPQSLMDKGHQKSELGDAIFLQRIEQLSLFLSDIQKS